MLMKDKISVGFFLFQRLTQLDFTGPHEVMSRVPEFEIHCVAPTKEILYTESGLGIVPDTTFDTCPTLDVVIIPGGPGVIDVMQDRSYLDFVHNKAIHSKYITSVCTGSLILAAAGLLNGYKATTHWLSLDLLAMFPVTVLTDRVVVDKNRITAGGVTSGIDFALTLIATLVGPTTAKEVQLMMQYDPAPPFSCGIPSKAESHILESVTNKRLNIQNERRKIIQQILDEQKLQ
jgi:cyclohexyl-isocyanide hydratase